MALEPKVLMGHNGPLVHRRRAVLYEQFLRRDAGPAMVFEVDRTKPAHDEDMAYSFSMEALENLIDQFITFVAYRITSHYNKHDERGAKFMRVSILVETFNEHPNETE